MAAYKLSRFVGFTFRTEASGGREETLPPLQVIISPHIDIVSSICDPQKGKLLIKWSEMSRGQDYEESELWQDLQGSYWEDGIKLFILVHSGRLGCNVLKMTEFREQFRLDKTYEEKKKRFTN